MEDLVRDWCSGERVRLRGNVQYHVFACALAGLDISILR